MTQQKLKSALRVERFKALEFSPRFEHGEMASVVEVCGSKDGSELGVGWGRLSNAYIAWTIKYDEVITVIEGMLILHANGEKHALGAKDSIWLPTGTELIYEAESALIHFAIHPSNWSDRQ